MTAVLVLLGLLFLVVLPIAAVISARAGVRDRNAAHRNLRGAYAEAGVAPPWGL